MKKILFIACISLLVTAVSAQRRPSVEFGIKGGLNVANLEVENAPDADSRLGIHVGGLAHIHISRQFAVQPELMFSMQGREQNIGGNEYKTKLSYINMPVLAQFMFGPGFRLQTGPQLGIMLDAETEVNDVEADVSKFYETAEIAWTIGAGYLTDVGVGFDIRYNIGLTNISETQPEVRNRVWQFGLFYQFRENPPARKRR